MKQLQKGRKKWEKKKRASNWGEICIKANHMYDPPHPSNAKNTLTLGFVSSYLEYYITTFIPFLHLF